MSRDCMLKGKVVDNCIVLTTQMNIELFFLCSWDRASQYCVNKCPTRCNYRQCILSVNWSTCFGWFFHLSSGAQITVSTTSGNSKKCPTRCNYRQCILSVNWSTCFGWFLHPSSGAQIAVSTASGTGQLLLLPVAIATGSNNS